MLLLAACGATMAADPPTLSSATTMEEAGMVDIRAVVPGIAQDIRYFGSDNFVGTRVDGYEAPRCYLKRQAADALAKVEAALRERHQRLRIFDCYRPARAVAHFMRWVEDGADQRTKATHYPDLGKAQLVGEYISPMSGHSRGATVDLTLLQCDASGAACTPLDMGTAFDFFGTRANTDSPDVDAAQRANRLRLREAMQAAGFRNYPMEWWHYTFQPEPSPGTYYDVPVTAPESPMPDAAIERLMQRYEGDVPGASLLVLRDGEARVHRGYGRSDLEHGIESGAATNYRLASVSKQFTAAAILLLAQDGSLGIDDPVKRWLPSLPPATAGITLRHLLTHTSGLLDYEDLMAEPYEGQIRDAGVLALLERENDWPSRRGARIATATAAMRCWRWSWNARRGWISRRSCAATSSCRWACTTPWPTWRVALTCRTAPGATAMWTGSGNAPTRARPARCWAMAGSTRTPTTSRVGMRRCTTIAC